MADKWQEDLRALREIAPSDRLWEEIARRTPDAGSKADRTGHRIMSRLALAAVVVAVAGAFLVATGRSHNGSPSHPSYLGNGRGGTQEIDWSRPLPVGVAVATVTDAQRSLPFEVVGPSGPAAAIFMDDPTQVQRPKRQIAFVFRTSTGPWWLIEHASAATVAQLQASVAQCHKQPVCIGDPTLVSLAKGTSAVATLDPEANLTRLTFLRNGLEFMILGPADTFSEERAAAFANQVIGS